MDERASCWESCSTTDSPSILAFPTCLSLFSMPDLSEATRQALLQTYVPPAATQDTRGQSSARVLCCSLRTRIVSCEPPWPVLCGSSSRWAAGFCLGSPICCISSEEAVKEQKALWVVGPGTGTVLPPLQENPVTMPAAEPCVGHKPGGDVGQQRLCTNL